MIKAQNLTLAHAVCIIIIGFISISSCYAQQAVSLDELLLRVQHGAAQDTKDQQKREAYFLQQKLEQKELLLKAKKTRIHEEAFSVQLEAEYAALEIKLEAKKSQLTKRLGVLKELFGTVQGVVGDARTNLLVSPISAQYSGRTKFLDSLIKKMNDNVQLATIEELEQVWFILQQEMVESGRVSKFMATVVSPDGSHAQQNVIRIGSFNLISNGKYLNYENNKALLILPRQPASRYTSAASNLESAEDGFIQFGIDPTGPSGGSYLEALIDSPSLIERIHQGREVGYIIIVLGIIALMISCWRLIVLSMINAKVTYQLKHPKQPKGNNPLGRVLIVHKANSIIDTETLELKLHEAILKEIPALNKWISYIKITSMVAPLLGLLGTVTGMIITFQALTVFGTSDPKAMAAGISSALVTTVLGLCVAIPTVFLHAIVSSYSKKIIHILEEQAAGIIADQSER